MVGYWATLALNIPDFTRFARSQKDQLVGQAIGLPPMMGLIALASVITTSATSVAIYGRAIWDPVELAGTLAGPFVLLGLVVIASTPSRATSPPTSSPRPMISRRSGPSPSPTGPAARSPRSIGVLIMPWKLLATSGGYIFVWLAGYSALLGPIAGILIADYWLIRRTGWTWTISTVRTGSTPIAAAGTRRRSAFAAGVLPNLPGFLKTAAPEAFAWIGAGWAAAYAYAWFIGLAVALAVYSGLMRTQKRPATGAFTRSSAG
jgi:NCS1 family nucleobase:cation symporter-1